tara:strand:- start:5185 stop:5550 length:366 start_codon:yes stop_codon:yes gene_type:complete
MDYNSKIKLNEKITLIENKDVLKNIFEIAKEDLVIDGKKKYSQNSSGIYFDLLLISDKNLLKIKDLIYNYFSETDSEINYLKENFDYKSYSNDDKAEAIQGNNDGPRLSNQEKNILLKNNK